MTTAQTAVGRFSYDTVTGTWEWDDEVFRIHGLRPGTVTPTTDYMLGCKHPEDRTEVADVLMRAATDGEPFSISYRLKAADGEERMVLLVCEAGVCGEGDDMTLTGYYIDQTEDFRQESMDVAHRAVLDSAEHRATIEQALGVVMSAYGLDADQAFGMLRWWSQHKNVKIRDLATRLVETASGGQLSHGELRKEFDDLLDHISSPKVVAADLRSPAAS